MLVIMNSAHISWLKQTSKPAANARANLLSSSLMLVIGPSSEWLSYCKTLAYYHISTLYQPLTGRTIPIIWQVLYGPPILIQTDLDFQKRNNGHDTDMIIDVTPPPTTNTSLLYIHFWQSHSQVKNIAKQTLSDYNHICMQF